MKICIAQTQSLKGNVQENINNHLNIVKRAIKLNSDVIIFPELSITGYEPKLAKKLAKTIDNPIFNRFQDLSDKNQITIGIGMPTTSTDDIYISMLIFQPHIERVVYSKQLLHDDELPYFSGGTRQTFITINETKIAFGICYESLQRNHFINAKQKGADIYIASVAKSKRGIEVAHNHFSNISKEFNTPILMSNSIGFCDNFLSFGKSAIWNKNGDLINLLDTENEGLLIYDTELESAEIHQLTIEKGKPSDLEILFQIYLNGKNDLEQIGIFQWTDNYPTRSIIKNDLKNGVLYILKKNNEIIGAINLSEEQETEYKSIDWKFDDSKVLVIHRLVVNPKHQKLGYAKALVDFAECFAKDKNYTSIRLDAYSQNTRVIQFYKKRNYLIRGKVHFPERAHPFYCMEKELIPKGTA
ncbi:GNAT family N-acetyltransferase [Winogradskyella psychrotolerans]|uniref:GNAT family N-acetyltransferase n=1 Tax=Winogradskyella psychrotolerans TaxID=1344585 RepID=UPI001C07152C|nr:GNAT family N-acetyltransferase [Winogradskyella psychrotolerans]MBU2930240.1 GNAT family N-acetyltransferase [Winogradskyella psychrotolerans]